MCLFSVLAVRSGRNPRYDTASAAPPALAPEPSELIQRLNWEAAGLPTGGGRKGGGVAEEEDEYFGRRGGRKGREEVVAASF